MNFDISNHTHRRLNILTGQWVLVSPHRSQRPWNGQVEKSVAQQLPSYDEDCYLCSGNSRANGVTNPDYKNSFAFTNDFSALVPEIPRGIENVKDLLISQSQRGICKVVCFSPNHSLTVAEMETEDIIPIIDTWIEEFKALSGYDFIKYIQIFENKGAIMGCSNPHPHGQIWAVSSIPNEPFKEDIHFSSYYEMNKRTILADYLELELAKNERIVIDNDHFAVVVPFWATWPFETMIISKRHITNILQLSECEKVDLARTYKELTCLYDNLFETSFPYSSGIHQAPVNTEGVDHWHLHVHFYPPLLRSASVKKFMVGYEMLANAQRDITPETAAFMLKSLSKIHYKVRDAVSFPYI